MGISKMAFIFKCLTKLFNDQKTQIIFENLVIAVNLLWRIHKVCEYAGNVTYGRFFFHEIDELYILRPHFHKSVCIYLQLYPSKKFSKLERNIIFI